MEQPNLPQHGKAAGPTRIQYHSHLQAYSRIFTRWGLPTTRS